MLSNFRRPLLRKGTTTAFTTTTNKASKLVLCSKYYYSTSATSKLRWKLATARPQQQQQHKQQQQQPGPLRLGSCFSTSRGALDKIPPPPSKPSSDASSVAAKAAQLTDVSDEKSKLAKPISASRQANASGLSTTKSAKRASSAAHGRASTSRSAFSPTEELPRAARGALVVQPPSLTFEEEYDLVALQSPKQITETLNDYVIGQEKAKRNLAVAVFYHYKRVKANLVNLAMEQAALRLDGLDEPKVTRTRTPANANYNVEMSSDFPETNADERSPFDKNKPTPSPNKLSRKHYFQPVNDQEPPNKGLLKSRASDVLYDDKSPQAVTSSSSSVSPWDDPVAMNTRRSEHRKAGEVRQNPTLAVAQKDDLDRTQPSIKVRPLHSETGHLTERSSTSKSDDDALNVVFDKSNVLLVGPTGSGKTLLARTLAKILKVPFSMSDATPFTQAGYVGEDVDVVIQRLLAAADYDVKRAEMGIVFIDEIDKIARRSTAPGLMGKDVSGEGVQQALLKILEGTVVNVTDKTGASAAAAGRLHSTGRNAANRTSNFNVPYSRTPGGGALGPGVGGAPGPVGGKGEVFAVDTSNILFILSGAFIGLEKIIEERVNKGSIGFEAAMRGLTNSENVPVANALDLLEPEDLITYGLIPEFIGRLPVLANVNHLDEDALVKVLTEPRNALLRQMEGQFAWTDVRLRVTRPALRAVAAKAITKKTGARGLQRIMHSILLDAMYEAPNSDVKTVVVDRHVVNGRKDALQFVREEDDLADAAVDADERAHLLENSRELNASTTDVEGVVDRTAMYG